MSHNIWIVISTMMFWLGLGFAVILIKNNYKRLFSQKIDAAKIESFTALFDPSSRRLFIGVALLLTMIFVSLELSLWLSMVLSLILAFWMLLVIHNKKKEKYLSYFEASLVTGLQMINSSLKAGLTLKKSLEVLAHNQDTVFAEICRQVLAENRMGFSLEDALIRARDRVKIETAFIAFGALVMGNRLGGDLPRILEKIISLVKRRVDVKGKLRSLTSQGRMQANLVMIAPIGFAIFLYIWDKERFSILTNTLPGQLILVLVVVLELLGAFFTRRILRFSI